MKRCPGNHISGEKMNPFRAVGSALNNLDNTADFLIKRNSDCAEAVRSKQARGNSIHGQHSQRLWNLNLPGFSHTINKTHCDNITGTENRFLTGFEADKLDACRISSGVAVFLYL